MRLALTSGDSSALRTAARTRFSTAAGMFAGPERPSQIEFSKPGENSPIVGRSGKVGERFAPATASARMRPALIWGAEEVPEKRAATSPDIVAAVAGGPRL